MKTSHSFLPVQAIEDRDGRTREEPFLTTLPCLSNAWDTRLTPWNKGEGRVGCPLALFIRYHFTNLHSRADSGQRNGKARSFQHIISFSLSQKPFLFPPILGISNPNITRKGM